MRSIKKIEASEIINSRGYPTISGKLTLNDSYSVRVSIPSFDYTSDYQ